jgi:uncharacterized protein
VSAQARRRPLAPLSADARQYAVAMRDGTFLATDVYLPRGRPPFNALLSRLPYDKVGDEFFMPDIARYWTDLGYAVVIQDVRGKARSGGEFEPLAWDAEDGFDTIEWIVEQPWAKGRVAMIGDSYAGFTQWAAASSGHPALVAITPRCTSHDRVDLLYDGGILALESATYWTAETALDEFLYDFPEPFDWSVRPVRDVIANETGREVPGWLDDMALRDPVHTTTPPSVPAGLRCLHLVGLYDVASAAQLRSWRIAREGSSRVHHLVIDAVDHSWRALESSDSAGTLEPLPGFLDRYNEPLREFLAAAFDGSDHNLPAVQWREDTASSWRTAPSWPPPEADTRVWWAGGSPDGSIGTLVESPRSPGGYVGEAAWLHEPRSPVPSRGNAFHELAERPDHSDLAVRPDVVQFETSSLERDVVLVGDATVRADFLFTGESAHLFAVLLDISPAGVSREIRAGRRLVVGPHRALATIELGPLAYHLPSGHRIGLRLSSSLFPRYALDSGDSAVCWSTWNPTTSERKVILGGPTGARLRCGVLPSRGGVSEGVQP